MSQHAYQTAEATQAAQARSGPSWRGLALGVAVAYLGALAALGIVASGLATSAPALLLGAFASLVCMLIQLGLWAVGIGAFAFTVWNLMLMLTGQARDAGYDVGKALAGSAVVLVASVILVVGGAGLVDLVAR